MKQCGNQLNNSCYHQFYCLMSVSFSTLVVFSNFIAGNLIEILGVTLPAAVIVFPITYILGDTITEIFGYKKMKVLIIFTMLINFLISIVGYLITKFPHANNIGNGEAYDIVFSLAPRVVVASSVGFLFGSISNAFIMHIFKQSKTCSKFVWGRIILSTLVGEFLDSGLFILITFVGKMEFNEIMVIMFSQFGFKVLYETIFSPILALMLKNINKRINSSIEIDN